MRRAVATLILAAAALPSCNPATGDGPLPANTSMEPPATNTITPPAIEDRVQRAAVDPRGDALVPGTAFHAMGQVRCVTPGRRSARDCTAGVVRKRDGGATVTIFSPEGRSRAVFFDANGVATRVDTAEADGSARQPFVARRSGATTVVTLGQERYEIPDAIVTGG